MSDHRAYNLTEEQAQEPAPPRGQGDGSTLDQHLAEHRRLPSAVGFEDEHNLFIMQHRSPGRLKYWLAVGVVLGAVAGAFVMKVLPAPSGFSAAHYAGLSGGLLVLLALVFLALGRTRIGINTVGIVARPWPPLPGVGVAVPIANIRRFRVGKTKRGQDTAYELFLLTRDEKEHRIIPAVILKRDAYLLALLLIDRVKKIRGAG